MKNIINNFNVVISMDIGSIVLDNRDLLNFSFTEDIFSYCLTGKLRFVDNKGIFEFGPLTGNESVLINYGIIEDIELEFFIYKMDKIEQDIEMNQGFSQIIELTLVDPLYFIINFFKFSKSWKDQNISDIIKDITENMIGVKSTSWDNFEKTSNKLDYFYMGYWTPRTSLNWLLKRARSDKNDISGYLYYNSVKGINLVTLNELLLQKNYMLTDPNDKNDYVYLYETQNLFYLNKIFEWSHYGPDNLALNKIMGGHLFGYDSNRKKFLNKTFTYKEGIKKHAILGESSLFPDISNTKGHHFNTNETNIIDLNNLYNNYFQKNYILQQFISILVQGSESRYPGGMIKIDWQSKSKEERYNKNLSGKYLVKSITNIFSGEGLPYYKQKMICIKNGYEESDNRKLLKSTLKNISE